MDDRSTPARAILLSACCGPRARARSMLEASGCDRPARSLHVSTLSALAACASARSCRADPRRLSRRATCRSTRAGATSRCRRRDLWAERVAADPRGLIARREGARRVRSRHHLGAARCRRGRDSGAIATADRAGRGAARKGSASPRLRHVRGRRASPPIRRDPLRADAGRLTQLKAADLARRHSRVTVGNPLVGLDGRAALLRRARRGGAPKPGGVRAARIEPRPGGLFDHLAATGRKRTASRRRAFSTPCCAYLGPIWPSRLTLGRRSRSAIRWRHPAIERDDATNGLVPLHKLSQWLAYSLIEPLQWPRHRR